MDSYITEEIRQQYSIIFNSSPTESTFSHVPDIIYDDEKQEAKPVRSQDSIYSVA